MVACPIQRLPGKSREHVMTGGGVENGIPETGQWFGAMRKRLTHLAWTQKMFRE